MGRLERAPINTSKFSLAFTVELEYAGATSLRFSVELSTELSILREQRMQCHLWQGVIERVTQVCFSFTQKSVEGKEKSIITRLNTPVEASHRSQRFKVGRRHLRKELCAVTGRGSMFHALEIGEK